MKCINIARMLNIVKFILDYNELNDIVEHCMTQ